MKTNILLALAIASFISVTSCSKDDATPSLTGKWEYFKEGSATSTGQEVLTNHQNAVGCTKDYIIISATTAEGHTFSGNTCVEHTFTTPYTRNGNTISVTSGATTSTSEIKTLDGTTLKIYYPDTSSQGNFSVEVYKRIN